MPNVVWKRGQFYTFYARMKIRVGGGQQMDIQEGDSFEYDGTIVKYAGAEFAQPGVRGAIRDDWATMDESGDVPTTFVADRPVAKSQSVNRDLARVQRHDNHMEASSLDEDVVLDVKDRKAKRDPRTGKGHVTKDDNRRKDPETGRILDINQSDIDQQDHTPIGRIKSPASMKVDIIANPGAARDIENRDSKSGYGRFAGRRRGPEVVEREGVTIKTNVGAVDPNVRASDGTEDGIVVGKIRRTDKAVFKEGVSVRDTSVRTSPSRAASQSKAAKAPAPSAPSRAAKAPSGRASSSSPSEASSPKLKKAIRICPDFPKDWNFFGKPEDKLARIKKLKASPQLLDAVHSTDSAAMQRVLEKHFPQHFS